MRHEGERQKSHGDLEATTLVTVRLCLLAVALLGASFFSIYLHHGIPPSYDLRTTPAVCLLLFCVLTAIHIKRGRVGRRAAALQAAGDIVLVTAALPTTGGAISPLIVLYLPVIMAAVVLSSRTLGLQLAAASLGVYALLVNAMERGWIASHAVFIVPTGGLVLQLIGLGSAMVLVAIATDYLRRTLNAGTLLVERSKQDLVELSTTQKILIDGIPDSVIIATLEGTVASIKQAALDLFTLTKEQAIGMSFIDLFARLFPEREFPRFEQGQHEMEIVRQDGSEMRIVYSCQPIADEQGKKLGMLYILQDITKLRSVEEQLALQERMAKLLAEKKPMRSGLSHPKLSGFVGESPIMRKVFQLIERVARSDANILVTGESGTGKELAAKAIHLSGERAHGPFVALNCGAVPENLIESELFGHKKGSFTGADSDHQGMFQQAHGGTLFLDEIGELPLHLQPKLLRAIQEKKIRMIGGDREIAIDVRIVSATNKNLRKEVEKGLFREDLFYRLNVVSICLPALRERKEDLPLLVNTILKMLVRAEVTPVVTPAAMQHLLRYDYPGNVRELENMLERALIMGGEVILPEHLPESVRAGERWRPARETQIVVDEQLDLPVRLDEMLAGIERHYLEVALLRTKGAKKKAAALLGMNFRSFRYRLQKFGIEDGE